MSKSKMMNWFYNLMLFFPQCQKSIKHILRVILAFTVSPQGSASMLLVWQLRRQSATCFFTPRRRVSVLIWFLDGCWITPFHLPLISLWARLLYSDLLSAGTVSPNQLSVFVPAGVGYLHKDTSPGILNLSSRFSLLWHKPPTAMQVTIFSKIDLKHLRKAETISLHLLIS